MIRHRNIADWQGQLEDDHLETDEPMFGTVEEGVIDRHLTFVPLGGSTIGPDNVQLAEDASGLYYHYQLSYAPPESERGRRLARR
jgi:hypothetical protein